MKKILIIISLFLTILITSCSKIVEYSGKTIFLFDTYITIKFYNTNDEENHYKNIKKLLTEISVISDDYHANNNDSVYDLNKNRSIPKNDLLKELIEYANLAKEKTSGYFEPLIGNLSRLWKKAIDEEKLPKEEEITSLLEEIRNSSIVIDDEYIKITGNANLDLGGFVKGYAAKKVYDYLKENKIDNYLINIGESTILVGKKVGEAFNIGLKNPLKDNSYYYDFKAKDIMISSSSIEYQSELIEGNLYHHLISPIDGYPKNNFQAISVIAEDEILLDAYSTALFVMNKDEAIKFSEDNNLKIILFKDEVLYKSDGINYA